MKKGNRFSIWKNPSVGFLLGIGLGLASAATASPLLEGNRPIADLYASEDSSNPTFAPSSDWDDELGIRMLLREAPQYRPFAFRLSQSVFWTDNAGYEDTRIINDTSDEDLYSTTFLGVNYLPKIVGNLYGEVLAHQYFYRYLDRSDLDFDDSRLGVGAIYVLRQLGDLSVNARYEYNRLTTATFDDKLLSEHTAQLGLYKPFVLTRQQFLYLRLLGEISLDADPGHIGRHEVGGTIGYRWKPADRWDLDLFYRYRYLDYTDRSRIDHQHLGGLQLRHQLSEKVDLGIAGHYLINRSDEFGFDYESGTVGAFFTFRIKL